MNALAEWHAEWTARHAAGAEFHPEDHPTPGSDYNLHHVDLDAPVAAQDEFHARANEIMGIS